MIFIATPNVACQMNRLLSISFFDDLELVVMPLRGETQEINAWRKAVVIHRQSQISFMPFMPIPLLTHLALAVSQYGFYQAIILVLR